MKTMNMTFVKMIYMLLYLTAIILLLTGCGETSSEEKENVTQAGTIHSTVGSNDMAAYQTNTDWTMGGVEIILSSTRKI